MIVPLEPLRALSGGTGSEANAQPSFMETFVRVKDKANLVVVEHQVGDEVKGLYLQVNANRPGLARQRTNLDPTAVSE